MFLRVLDNEARNARPNAARRAAFEASNLEIRMFHTGQGEAILVVFEGTRAWLIDAGYTNFPNPNRILGEELIAYMEGRGLVLETIVPSHAHVDHAGAFATILGSNSPSVSQSITIYRSDGFSWRRLDRDWLDLYRDAIRTADTEITLSNAHREVDIAPNLSAHLFAGSGASAYTSLFVQLRYRDARILFTGDAHCGYEVDLLNTFGAADFEADVLKVTHHGSSSGTATPVVQAASPGIAIASTGDDGGHRLEQDTLDRLGGHIGKPPSGSTGVRPVFETVVHGDIVLRTDGLPYIGGMLYQVELNAPGEFANALDAPILDLADINRDQNLDPDCGP